MNLFYYKNVFFNIFANEFCFYMILASLFKRTQCMSGKIEDQLKLYYADLVRDNTEYGRGPGKERGSFSYVKQERMEDLYIPLIEKQLFRELCSMGWDPGKDQAEVYIEPAARAECIRQSRNKKRKSHILYGHIFRFVGLYYELSFQLKEVDGRCEVYVVVHKPDSDPIGLRLLPEKRLAA